MLALTAVHNILEQESGQLADQVDTLRRDLTTLNRKIDRLTDMRAEGELSAQQYTEQKDRLWADREQLEGRIEELEARMEERSVRKVELAAIRDTLQDFDAIWDALDDAERRRACQTVIEYARLRRADEVDLELELKVHYMPEHVIPLPNYNRRNAGDGAEGLSQRELAYLAHKQEGRSEQEIAALWDTARSHVFNIRKRALGCLGVGTVEEAIELAAQRLERERHALPMEGRMRKRHASKKFRWTEKRKQILRGLRLCTPRQHIAERMGIEPKTLTERIRRMKKAARVDKPEELVEYAVREGII